MCVNRSVLVLRFVSIVGTANLQETRTFRVHTQEFKWVVTSHNTFTVK